MAQSDVFAVAAHLHVLLRRKTGRVIDIDWLAVNEEYARTVARFCREKAAADGHAELLPWADKLDALIPEISAGVKKPLLQSAVDKIRAVQDDPASRYVGGLR